MKNIVWVSGETRLPIILTVVDVSDKVLSVDSLMTCTCTCITHELMNLSPAHAQDAEGIVKNTTSVIAGQRLGQRPCFIYL
jgi:hypothetical protein